MRLILLFLLPCFVFASGTNSGDYDIIERTFNFLLFVGILYYYLAKPMKNFYINRKKSIADELDLVQKKLEEARLKKQSATKKLEKAKMSSDDVMITARKEAENISKKILEDLDSELAILEKLQEENKRIEKRKMTREVVEEVLDEIFEDDLLEADSNKFVDIILKKVA